MVFGNHIHDSAGVYLQVTEIPHTNRSDLSIFLTGMIVMGPIMIVIGMHKIQTIVLGMEIVTLILGSLPIKPAVLAVEAVY